MERSRPVLNVNIQTVALTSEIEYTKELLEYILSMNQISDVRNSREYLEAIYLQHNSLQTIVGINMLLEDFIIAKKTIGISPTVDPTVEETVNPTVEKTVEPAGEKTVDAAGEETVDPAVEETAAEAREKLDDSQQCELNSAENAEGQSLLQVYADASEIDQEAAGNQPENEKKTEPKQSTICSGSSTSDAKESSQYDNLDLRLPDIFFKAASRSTKSTGTNNDDSSDIPAKKEDDAIKIKTISVGPVIRDPPEIQIGDMCMISHVLSPVKFYIFVINEDTANLDELSTLLGDFYGIYGESFLTKEDAMEAIQKFCAVCVDRFWYRGEILDWLQEINNSDSVRVQLVDHGHEYIVPFRSLRELDPSLCKFPKLVHQCRFSYLYPCGSTQESRLVSWDAKSVEGFLKILGDLNNTTFKILHTYRPNNRKSTDIELINANENDETNCVGQRLINENVAVEIIDQQHEQFQNRTFIDRIKAVQGLLGDDLDDAEAVEKKKIDIYFDSVYEQEAGTLSEALFHYNARDEAEMCRYMLRTGRCYRGKWCKFRHTPFADGFTRDRVPVFTKALAEYAPLRPGDEVDVIISHICNIQQFYVQVIRGPYVGETLEQLIDTMNAPEIVRQYKRLALTPALGEIVIVKHWNSYWYRGMVNDIVHYERPRKIEATVYIVDFGDTLSVGLDDLRTMMESFLRLPFQATMCRFGNVRRNREVDQTMQTAQFEREALGCRFQAQIMANPGYVYLKLFSDGHDFGLELIAEGCGEFEDDPIYPSDDCLLIE